MFYTWKIYRCYKGQSYMSDRQIWFNLKFPPDISTIQLPSTLLQVQRRSTFNFQLSIASKLQRVNVRLFQP
jgi:hypothetical protein